MCDWGCFESNKDWVYLILPVIGEYVYIRIISEHVVRER